MRETSKSRKSQNLARLKRLPPGAVTATGWLREQLVRNKAGMGGCLDALEPRMIATPYTTREPEPGWAEKERAGWGAEISGNYWGGLIGLAFALDDAELKSKAEQWVNAVLANQGADDYLGTYTEDDNRFDDFNAAGTNCGMQALLTYYEATGRQEVLEAVQRCMLWFCEHWAGDRKTCYGGIGITESMLRCYGHTGDERLVRFCEEYYAFLEKKDYFGRALSAMNSDVLRYNSCHSAGYANQVGRPAEMYAATGEARYLRASLNAYRKAKAKVVHVTGGFTCQSEYLSPLGLNVESEYCSFTHYAKSLAQMIRVTGDPTYGDELERVIFNAAQGARKKDERAIAYLSSPNQLYATIRSSNAHPSHQVYAPCVPVACCAVNSVRILPEFIGAAVWTDSGADGAKGALYFAAYGPFKVRHGGLVVKLDTSYPFRDTIDFKVTADVPLEKTLHFRIPQWCDVAELSVNGTAVNVACRPGTFAVVRRAWRTGDVVTLRLPMQVRITKLNDADRSRLYPLAIEYGPLVFALPVAAQWHAWEGQPVTPLPNGWHWYNVEAVRPDCDLDVYEKAGMMKFLIPYNIAVDENLKPEDVRVSLCQPEGYPWETPWITLRLQAYKAPYSYAPARYRTFEPHAEGGRLFVTDEKMIEMVPYGCTNLRITYLPRADLAPGQG